MDDHPVLLQLDSLRAALATFQHEAHSSAVKLQHHSLSTSRALDRVHALEHENTVLTNELSTLRPLSSDLTSNGREIQINQLTLSLRTLNEKVSTTENILGQRTQDLTHALVDLARSRMATDAAYELASRIRGREEMLKSHQGELQLKLRLAEERARMSERAVSEYADLVRALEGRGRGRQTAAAAAAGPYNSNNPNGSSQTLVHPDEDNNNKSAIETLIREFAVEREDLQSQLSSTQHELALFKSQHDAQAKTLESTLAELAHLRYKLQLLDRDDTTAAKMVSRYMKFSQQSTNNLQTTLRTLTTRHTATITSLTTHTHSLTHTLQSLQSHNTRLLASLDDIGGELLKESFGRRREVKVRMRLVRREERVLEGLRRWLRSSEERVGRVNDEDDARTWLNEMVQDAKILVDELDSPLHLTLPHPDDDLEDGGTIETPSTPVVISGSLARLITIQSTINELVDELQQEQSRRIRAEEALVRYEIHQEVLQKEDDDDDDDEKEGTDLPLPSPLPPPLPPKNLSLVELSSSPSPDHHHPLPPPPPSSETRALSDTQPELEPSEPGVLAHIPTTVTSSPSEEEEEITKTEEDTKVIPTIPGSNLPPSPPISLPPDDDDDLSEQTITATTATAPVIPLERTPTSTNVIQDDNERRNSLEVPPPIVAVTATEEGVTTNSPERHRTVEVLVTKLNDSRANGVVVEERNQAGMLKEEGLVLKEEEESMENGVERGSRSATSPSPVVEEETGGSDVTTTTLSSTEGTAEVDPVAGVEVGWPAGKIEGTAVDFSLEHETEMAKNTTTTTTTMTHANGDSIVPEAVDTVVKEEPPPENNQTQQHQLHALDSEIDLLKSSQQPPPPLPPTIEHSERESAQQDSEVPKAPEVSLADDSTRDVLCTLEPPTIIVEPIPIPVTGAYTGTLNGVVADPTTHSGSGWAVTTQHDGLISNPSLELDAVVAPISSSSSSSSSSLPIVPSSSSPLSVPLSLSPPLPPPPPPPPPQQHPLLQHLQKARTRYDHIQRAFHDCHIALESLKSSFLHPTITPYPRTHAALVPQKGNKDEWFKAIIQRLDDHTEDVRVELEIRISDEEVLGRGYEALLSVPGALDSHDHHQDDRGETLAEVEAQILAFVEGSEPGIEKALGGFHKKLEDLEHDVAVVKRAVHDSLQGISPAFDYLEDPPVTGTVGGGGGGWTSWIPGRAPSPTPPAGPAATFGNIMTNRQRAPIRRAVSALGLADSNHHHAQEGGGGGGGDIIKNLNLRIPMPDLSFVFLPSSSSLSPPHYQDSSPTPSGISTGGFGLGLGVGGGGAVPRSRTVSTMYMLGMGMGGRNSVVSSPLLQKRRIVSAVPSFGNAPAAAKMNEGGKEQPQEVDVD